MSTTDLSRRRFLKTSSAAAAGAGIMLSGAAPVFSLPATAATAPKPLKITPQKKALVFIMLDGGNDSYNTLVPVTSAAYKEYAKTRSNLALAKKDLLELKGFEDAKGRRFGIHPAMPEVQSLFNDKQLSFVANIGPLIEPVRKEQFYNNSARLPVGLLSHSDQFKHWQTSRPGERLNRGWFGQFADALQRDKSDQQISMNVSLAGSNIMQNGYEASPYVIKKTGSVGLEINENPSRLNDAILESFEGLLEQDYSGDPLKQAYLEITREAQAQHEIFKRATQGIAVPTAFSDSDLSQQLRKVAQTIKAADKLGMQQQTFFLRYIGWDHHDELLDNHQRMLGVLSKAMGELQLALQELGVADNVITFTGSDFGRTLTSNGNGTDHGWGGHVMVMGNDVHGGKIFGEYPSLALGSKNPLDVGDGVLVPTIATDELYAELALWFGVDRNELNSLFPNLKNFYRTSSKQLPLGVVRM